MKRSILILIVICMFSLGGCKNDAGEESGTEVFSTTDSQTETMAEVETDEGISEKIGETITEAIGETATIPADNQEQPVEQPSKEQVLQMREQVLTGMSEEEITRLTTNIKDFNSTWESRYFYSAIFEKLEDPENLYWNYFDESGDVVVGFLTDSDGTVTEVIEFNRFDAESLTALIAEMQESVENEELYNQLQILIDEIELAAETHEVEHAINMFHILHDMDYFLLRYGIEDVGPYVQDKSFISKYYGSLILY